MSQVTLRDLATNEDIVVPPEGFIFGRVGGDADIQLEDNSISRRQARVSLKGGQWLLETLAVPQGQRAPRPVQLQEGATFNVGQSEFEVVQIEQAEEEEEADPGARTIQPPSKGKPGQPPMAAKKAPPPPNAKTAPSAPMQKRAAAAKPAAAEEDAGGGDEVPAKGIGAMFVAAPKGLAYYLVNVPKMLVNPFGTVRKTIEEQPNEPMGKIELIGYALPALLGTGMLGSIAGGLAALIGPGHHFLLMSFLPIPAIIGGFIGAIITGFIFHPVLTWIITKLKGESDARSRTNYFLQTMTLSILLAVPNALGVILAALPIPFINLLGPVLSVVATLVSLYVTIQWFEYFKVVKWVKTVLLVLGALAVLGTAYGLVMGVINTIRGFGSGGGSTPVAVAEGDAAEAVEAATAGLEEMPTDPEEAKAWAERRNKALMAKAAEAQKKALAAANDAAEKANEAAEKGKDTPPPPEPVKAAEPTKKDPVKAVEKPAEPEPEPVKDTPPPPTEVAVPTGSGSYGKFARQRDAIEKMLEADPTPLKKSPDLQKLYGDYSEAVYEVDKKWGKETAKKPEHAKLNARLRDAELFDKAGKTVEQLAGKLGVK